MVADETEKKTISQMVLEESLGIHLARAEAMARVKDDEPLRTMMAREGKGLASLLHAEFPGDSMGAHGVRGELAAIAIQLALEEKPIGVFTTSG